MLKLWQADKKDEIVFLLDSKEESEVLKRTLLEVIIVAYCLVRKSGTENEFKFFPLHDPHFTM